MTDEQPELEADEPKEAVYQPFPSFDGFASAAGYDDSTFEPWAERLQALRASADPTAVDEAVRTATRIAAVDSGAIEGLYDVDRGFTISAAASVQALEAAHLQLGDKAQRHIEDALSGYQHVLDLATKNRPMSEHSIRVLHAIICRHQDTYQVINANGELEHRELPKGTYKTFPNNPHRPEGTVHAYAPPGTMTEAEMARLVENLSSKKFKAAPAVLQAAYAHYAYVCIHPFADGNGRVARAMASAYLYRKPGIPLVIYADEKGTYFGALELADQGSTAEFVRFIRERAIDTILWLETTMRRQPVVPAESMLAKLAGTLLTEFGMSHGEVDQLEKRVRDEVGQAFTDEIRRLGVDAREGQLVMNRGEAVSHSPVPTGYRNVPNAQAVVVTGHSKPPATGHVNVQYPVYVPKAAPVEDRRAAGIPDGVEFAVFRASADRIVDVRISDIYPAVTESFRMRLRAVAENEIARMVTELVALGEASLRKNGYI